MSSLIERYESHGLKIRIYDDSFYISRTKYERYWNTELYGNLSEESQKNWDKLKTLEGTKQVIEEILNSSRCDPELWNDPYALNDRFDSFVPEN